jgi:hypothetical protein
MGVQGQQTQLITDIYQTVTGYDVSNFTAPISSVLIVLPATGGIYACMYACSITANCCFAVLTANYTCNIYNSSARTSVYALTNSSIYQPKANG